MQPLSHGRYTARLATTPADLAAALALRQSRFRTGRGLPQPASDADAFDDACTHILVSNTKGDLVCCFRVLRFASGADIARSYAAQFYDLSPLQTIARPLMELGRFCLHPDHSDPDILRLAWAALTRLVDQGAVTMLFGCSSFDGADPVRHRAALGWLARNHLGPTHLRPAHLRPTVLAPDPVSLTARDAPISPPVLPPLLRSYLAMGGWVSDCAVIDQDLNTLHVFTALDIAAIPPARARALRALAALAHTSS